MSVTEIIKAAQFITIAGEEMVLLNRTAWQEVVAWLEATKIETELAAWDSLSDEALLNFEAQLGMMHGQG